MKQPRLLIVIALLLMDFMTIGQSLLADYIEQAVRVHPGTQAAAASAHAAEAAVGLEKSWPDPELGLAYYVLRPQTRVGSRSADISVSQPIPWFGTLKLRSEVAMEKKELSFQQFRMQALELQRQFQEGYYQLARHRRDQHLLQDFLKTLNGQAAVVLAAISSGEADLSDALLLELETSEIETRISNLQEEEELLVATLNRLLQRSITTPVITDAKSLFLPQKLPTPQDSFGRNPSYTIAEHRQSIGERQLLLAKKSAKPQFALGLTYGLVQPYTNSPLADNGKDIISPRLAIRLPIHSSRNRALVRQAYHLDVQEDHALALTSLNIRTLRDQLVVRWENAKRNEQLYRDLEMLTLQNLDLLNTGYRAGQRPFSDLLDAHRKLLQYRLAASQNEEHIGQVYARWIQLFGIELN